MILKKRSYSIPSLKKWENNWRDPELCRCRVPLGATLSKDMWSSKGRYSTVQYLTIHGFSLKSISPENGMDTPRRTRKRLCCLISSCITREATSFRHAFIGIQRREYSFVSHELFNYTLPRVLLSTHLRLSKDQLRLYLQSSKGLFTGWYYK